MIKIKTYICDFCATEIEKPFILKDQLGNVWAINFLLRDRVYDAGPLDCCKDCVERITPLFKEVMAALERRNNQ